MNLTGPAKHLNSQPLPHNHLCKTQLSKMATTKCWPNEGQAGNNWTNRAAILSAKSLHVQSQTGCGKTVWKSRDVQYIFAEIANIRPYFLSLYLGQENTEVKACRDLLPWFSKICKLYFWEKFEWRENMPWVFPVALLSYVKASNEVFVNGWNITGKAMNNDVLVSFYVCINLLCTNHIRVCGAWPTRRSSEFAEKPD